MDIGHLDPARLSLVQPNPSTMLPQNRPENRMLIRAVDAVNKSGIMGGSQELVFAFDEELKRPILKIVDKETGEVVQQVPPEYVLRLAQQAKEEK